MFNVDQQRAAFGDVACQVRDRVSNLHVRHGEVSVLAIELLAGSGVLSAPCLKELLSYLQVSEPACSLTDVNALLVIQSTEADNSELS